MILTAVVPMWISSETKQRSILCKIRLSAHNLAIERGRHLGLRASDRICILTWHATLALKTIEGSK